MASPRITILTPSFNQGAYIEQNIWSVMNQNYADVEHLVIDGGSTDNTVETLKRYPHLRWVSEKDGGQADALNKGLAMATGEIIGWINSDDYYEENILADVVEQFADPDVQWVVGNLTMVWEGLDLKVTSTSTPVTFGRLVANADIVAQQPTFFRKSAILTAGGWNRDLHMVMDFDLWVRVARDSTPKMVDRNWAYFRLHAGQKTGWHGLLRQTREINAILKREGVPFVNRLPFLSKKCWYMAKGAVKNALIAVGLLPKRGASVPKRLSKADRLGR